MATNDQGSGGGGRFLIFLLILFPVGLWVYYNLIKPAQSHPPIPVPDLAGSFGQVDNQRSLAMQWARTVRADAQQGTISPQSMLPVQERYFDAKAAYDGWLTHVQSLMDLGSVGDQTQQLQDELQAAKGKGDEFINLARMAHTSSLPPEEHSSDENPTNQGGPPADGAGPPIGEALNAVIESLIKVGQDYRGAQKEWREEVRHQIESHRWQDFDKVD